MNDTTNEAILTIATNIRRQRLARGITQKELAEKVGCSSNDVSWLESTERKLAEGRAIRNPSIGLLSKYASALDVKLTTLPEEE